MEPSPGMRILGLEAAYVVERPLGEGGFAKTLLAHREADGTAVVLKVLRLDRRPDFKALELFEREAAVLAGLSHPGIPRTFELFVWDGQRAHAPDALAGLPDGGTLRWVMVQSLAPGRSLAQRIAARERLDTNALHDLLWRMLDVLQYLHGQHPPVIHRDITPGNVVLADDGTVTLVDFGAIRDRLRSASTVGSTSVGTFGFIPMEQMMGQARPASDLFSLAMTLVVVATHRSPESLPLDEHTGMVDLDALGLALPPTMLAALRAMLQPIVGQRAPDVTTARALLQGYVPPAALVAAGPRLPAVRAELRHPRLWATSMGAGGLAAGLVYLVFFDSFSETALIQLSSLWVAPVGFGIVGRWADRAGKPSPVATAVLGAGAAVLALVAFIYGIFPAL